MTELHAVGKLAVDEPQPQAPPCCTKCNSPPINSQCANQRIAV